jgi:uncharacterized protein (DUF1697 family)
MERYIAFLRGINVSGQKIIKMEALRKAFIAEGFTDVKTYIQSGNVIFNSDEVDTERLIQKIEDMIENQFGFRTDVIIRKQIDIESVLNSLQISRLESGVDRKYYITFLKKEYNEPLIVPLFSKNMDIEVIYKNKKDFISISNLFNGSYGFPNAFIEKLTGIPATTRNPETLKKILEL